MKQTVAGLTHGVLDWLDVGLAGQGFGGGELYHVYVHNGGQEPGLWHGGGQSCCYSREQSELLAQFWQGYGTVDKTLWIYTGPWSW